MTDRAVSVALGYVLVTSITVVLVGGLIISGTSFVEDQRETVSQQELTVVGNQLAGNIEQVDRMVTADPDNDPAAAVIDETYQERVSGSTYTVRLNGTTDPAQLELTSPSTDATITVNVAVRTEVRDDSVANGGVMRVFYDGDKLVIEDG